MPDHCSQIRQPQASVKMSKCPVLIEKFAKILFCSATLSKYCLSSNFTVNVTSSSPISQENVFFSFEPADNTLYFNKTLKTTQISEFCIENQILYPSFQEPNKFTFLSFKNRTNDKNPDISSKVFVYQASFDKSNQTSINLTGSFDIKGQFSKQISSIFYTDYSSFNSPLQFNFYYISKIIRNSTEIFSLFKYSNKSQNTIELIEDVKCDKIDVAPSPKSSFSAASQSNDISNKFSTFTTSNSSSFSSPTFPSFSSKTTSTSTKSSSSSAFHFTSNYPTNTTTNKSSHFSSNFQSPNAKSALLAKNRTQAAKPDVNALFSQFSCDLIMISEDPPIFFKKGGKIYFENVTENKMVELDLPDTKFAFIYNSGVISGGNYLGGQRIVLIDYQGRVAVGRWNSTSFSSFSLSSLDYSSPISSLSSSSIYSMRAHSINFGKEIIEIFTEGEEGLVDTAVEILYSVISTYPLVYSLAKPTLVYSRRHEIGNVDNIESTYWPNIFKLTILENSTSYTVWETFIQNKNPGTGYLYSNTAYPPYPSKLLTTPVLIPSPSSTGDYCYRIIASPKSSLGLYSPQSIAYVVRVNPIAETMSTVGFQYTIPSPSPTPHPSLLPPVVDSILSIPLPLLQSLTPSLTTLSLAPPPSTPPQWPHPPTPVLPQFIHPIDGSSTPIKGIILRTASGHVLTLDSLYCGCSSTICKVRVELTLGAVQATCVEYRDSVIVGMVDGDMVSNVIMVNCSSGVKVKEVKRVANGIGRVEGINGKGGVDMPKFELYSTEKSKLPLLMTFKSSPSILFTWTLTTIFPFPRPDQCPPTSHPTAIYSPTSNGEYHTLYTPLLLPLSSTPIPSLPSSKFYYHIPGTTPQTISLITPSTLLLSSTFQSPQTFPDGNTQGGYLSSVPTLFANRDRDDEGELTLVFVAPNTLQYIGSLSLPPSTLITLDPFSIPWVHIPLPYPQTLPTPLHRISTPTLSSILQSTLSISALDGDMVELRDRGYYRVYNISMGKGRVERIEKIDIGYTPLCSISIEENKVMLLGKNYTFGVINLENGGGGNKLLNISVNSSVPFSPPKSILNVSSIPNTNLSTVCVETLSRDIHCINITFTGNSSRREGECTEEGAMRSVKTSIGCAYLSREYVWRVLNIYIEGNVMMTQAGKLSDGTVWTVGDEGILFYPYMPVQSDDTRVGQGGISGLGVREVMGGIEGIWVYSCDMDIVIGNNEKDHLIRYRYSPNSHFTIQHPSTTIPPLSITLDTMGGRTTLSLSDIYRILGYNHQGGMGKNRGYALWGGIVIIVGVGIIAVGVIVYRRRKGVGKEGSTDDTPMGSLSNSVINSEELLNLSSSPSIQAGSAHPSEY
jgi:hypothetical protein